MSDPKKILELIKEKDVKYVDYRFTDPKGKWQHVAQHIVTVDEDLLTDGIMFDGSSITGWKAINESDMQLKPDLSTATMDPFAAQPQLILFCDTVDPVTGQAYDRCPRQTARKGLEYLKSTGLADTAYFGPEAEFFIFDDVRFHVGMEKSYYFLSSEEGPYLTGADIEGGNLAHRPPVKGGYFPVPPIDSGTDIRAEMLTVMAEMGVNVEKHHHEVAPSQHELGIKFDTLLKCADAMQIYKYVVHNVAASYGKTATFMPKPVKGDNGSGMHLHQSLWKGNTNLFAGQGYAGLSEMALYYIGGVIKHAKAINAITNPTTNSYKRLIPGFEAPVLLAYSSRNRSASCRIPFGAGTKAKRVEVRFPDPAANPYLAYTALMMAGLDGIKNKIHPGQPMDKNLYDLPPEELKNVPQVCGSLREALEHLEQDHDFLLAGDVFTRDQLESYAELRWEEVYAFEHSPHPIEFQMYYSV